MAGLNYQDQTKVREAVKKYLNKNGMTSLRKISAFVESETGINPSATTIGRLVREYGYDREKVDWEKSK